MPKSSSGLDLWRLQMVLNVKKFNFAIVKAIHIQYPPYFKFWMFVFSQAGDMQ